MLKRLSLFVAVCITVMSFAAMTVSVQAQEAENGKAYILSFDDGSYCQLLGGEGLEYAVISDEYAESEGGKSLCWTKDSNSVTFLFPDKGVENLHGKKTLNFRVYSKPVDSSATSRFNIVVYNRTGDGLYQWQHYPITGEGWATVSVDFSNLSFWSDSAPAAVRFEAKANYTAGDKLYIDSAWVEYAAPTTFTEKNCSDSLTVFDFDISAKGSNDLISYGGGTYGSTDDVDFDSTYSYAWNMDMSTSKNYMCLRSLDTTIDWSQYDYAVLRLKAAPSSDPAVTTREIEVYFSDVYASAPTSWGTTLYVSTESWQDYKIKLSDISGLPSNIKSMVVRPAAGNEDDSHIYFDALFLTNSGGEATLAAPEADVSGNNVNTYLTGNNTVNFVFAENLRSCNFAQGVAVFKNSSVSDEAFITNVNGNTLSVTFADALSPESSYMIILDKNYIRGVSGNAMAEDAVCSFTTGKADYSIDSIEIVKGENTVSANAKVSNNTFIRKDATLFIAAYSGNKLEFVIPASAEAGAVSGTTRTATIEEIEDVNAYTYKAFVWDSLAGLKPIPAEK